MVFLVGICEIFIWRTEQVKFFFYEVFKGHFLLPSSAPFPPCVDNGIAYYNFEKPLKWYCQPILTISLCQFYGLDFIFHVVFPLFFCHCSCLLDSLWLYIKSLSIRCQLKWYNIKGIHDVFFVCFCAGHWKLPLPKGYCDLWLFSV